MRIVKTSKIEDAGYSFGLFYAKEPGLKRPCLWILP